MKTKLFFATIGIATILSCKTSEYYQVYEVQSQDVKNEGDVLTAENEDCRITYNMWSEGGNLCFMIQNKTDKDLYVVMPKSFFILNGLANDYYPQAFHSVPLANPAMDGIDVDDYITNKSLWYSNLSSASKAYNINTEGKEFICLPPRSAKFILGFNISNIVYKDCNHREENYPKDKSKVVTFTKERSPITFSNRIAYTFNEDGSDVHYVEHFFWLSSLTNYSEKAAFSKMHTTDCESQMTMQAKFFIMSGPDKFYNKYSKTPIRRLSNGQDGYLSVKKQRD